MKSVGLILLLPIVFFAHVTSAAEVTPVQKVIQMLEGMMKKAEAEKNAEITRWTEFNEWCENTLKETQRLIDNGKMQIAELTAKIEDHKENSKRLAKEIEGHSGDIACWKGDVEAATNVRALDKGDYDALHKDYSESIDALGRAIDVLKTQKGAKAQASLVQVSALTSISSIPESARAAIDAFVQQANFDEPPPGVNPEAHGYEFQSQGVIELLKKLLQTFTEKRSDTEAAEAKAIHEFELLTQNLNADIADAQENMERKEEEKATHDKKRATAEGDLKDTTMVKETDEEYYATLDETHRAKEAAFKSRQKLRGEEKDAILKAIEIISNQDLKGNADKHLPKLIQENKVSFAQLRSSLLSQNDAKLRAADYLTARASELDSKVLESIVSRLGGSDPFAKLKTLIQDLITRLMEEANEEAEHKGWCNTELATNKKERTKLSDGVASLKAQIEELTASNVKLNREAGELRKSVSELQVNLAEATKERRDENEKNRDTVQDAQDAQRAVSQALDVLNKFYAKAAEATAFIQGRKGPRNPEIPEIFEESYTGQQDENSGVIGMLEVINSDFARLETDTQNEEAESLREFETMKSETLVSVEAKETDAKHKENTVKRQEAALADAVTNLDKTTKRFEAANHAYDKLKPACVDAGVSYEERVQRREEEIESLKEALKILSGDV